MVEVFSYCVFANGVVVWSDRLTAQSVAERADEKWGELRSIAHLYGEQVSEQTWKAFRDNKGRLISVDEATKLFVGFSFENQPKPKREPEKVEASKPESMKLEPESEASGD